jgi:cytochrome b
MAEAEPQPRRWDPLVKITHWGIVAAIIINALVVGEGSVLHIWAGYVLVGLLAIRLFWGLIGPMSARFTAFPPSPFRAIAHIRDILAGRKEEHKSHNPLGALMVYAIWMCLIVIAASGIAMAGPPPGLDGNLPASGQLLTGGHEGGEYESEAHENEYGEEGESEGEEMMEEIHEVAVNLLYLLIALHLAGVVFETVRSGRRTLTAMLPGGR